MKIVKVFKVYWCCCLLASWQRATMKNIRGHSININIHISFFSILSIPLKKIQFLCMCLLFPMDKFHSQVFTHTYICIYAKTFRAVLIIRFEAMWIPSRPFLLRTNWKKYPIAFESAQDHTTHWTIPYNIDDTMCVIGDVHVTFDFKPIQSYRTKSVWQFRFAKSGFV